MELEELPSHLRLRGVAELKTRDPAMRVSGSQRTTVHTLLHIHGSGSEDLPTLRRCCLADQAPGAVSSTSSFEMRVARISAIRDLILGRIHLRLNCSGQLLIKGSVKFPLDFGHLMLSLRFPPLPPSSPRGWQQRC